MFVFVDELLPILFVPYGMRIQLQIVPAGIFLSFFPCLFMSFNRGIRPDGDDPLLEDVHPVLLHVEQENMTDCIPRHA